MDISAEQQQTQPADPMRQRKPEDWRSRIDSCKTYRRKLIANWVTNIDYRRGKPFASQTDEDRVVVNLDWSMFKSKEAALWSQVPQVRVDHPPQSLQAGPWVHAFEQRLNDTLIVGGIETAMTEVLPDVINASGFGVVLVSHESITKMVEIPSVDFSTYPPDQAQIIQQTGKMPDGSDIPMSQVPKILDHRYRIMRISPADFLWPINFTGSSFDDAPWIGRSGRVTWAQAVQLFGLTEQDRATVIGDNRPYFDRLTHDIDKDKLVGDEMVGFDEIFYKEFEYSEDPASYSTIHRLVFVAGKDEPVVDEQWKGQSLGQDGQVMGALRFPIRVLTLTYITDETIPPSDSAIGRPQVNEINKARTQMIQQRERSLPIRWFDVNRIDPIIQQSLMRGVWQGMIPVQGQGDKSIGEVARAAFPQEDFTFDNIAKADLNDAWQIGPNQAGNFGSGRQSASESNIVEQNFRTRVGRERAKVGKFFTTIAEVIGGIMCLTEDPASFGQGFDPGISTKLSYSILADSSVFLDSDTRRERLKDFINFTAKSGWVNIEPVLREYATLSGLDPNVVIQAPQPKPPVEPNISLRLTGVEDLMNPMTLAFLMKSGQAPSADLIEQAKRLIQEAVTPPPGTPMLGQQQPGAPGPGQPPSPPGQAGPMPSPVGPPPMPAAPAPFRVGEAHPNWSALERINKRTGEDN